MNRHGKFFVVLLAAAVMAQALCVQAERQPRQFRDWPAGTSPREIGKKVAEHFVVTPHTNFGRPLPPPQITYPEVATWVGALTFARVTADKELQDRLVKRFEPLFGPEANLVPNPVHVDNTVFGAVPLELYILTKDKKYHRRP